MAKSKTTEYLERHPERRTYYAYLRLKCQAKYRNEPFAITEQEFEQLWAGRIHLKGRGKGKLRMTRLDRQQPWSVSNIIIGTQSEIDLYYNTRRLNK